jgi:adapter protein MecA 1/2
MKIERISENILRVTISLDDLEERNINLDSLNYNSPAAQELFWDMMEQAEIQFGFDLSDSQLIIEPISDLEDEFIITITKIDEDGDFESIHKYIKSKLRKSDLKIKKKSKKLYSTLLIYSFESFDDLCLLGKELSAIYNGESSLYRYGSIYYLVLVRSSFTVTNINKFEALLDEYGSRVSNINFYEGYLNEYGIKIAEGNALEIIKNYYN